MTTFEFSFSARELDASGRRFSLPVRGAWLRGVLEGTAVSATEEEGKLDIRASRTGTDVIIHGTVQAELTVPCSRCLEPARVSVNEPLSALMVPATASSPTGKRTARDGDDEGDIDPEEADIMTYDGEWVVLDDLVRDELLLGIPMIPLCSEGCAGISPRPLQDDPVAGIDPRLAPLLKLQQKT